MKDSSVFVLILIRYGVAANEAQKDNYITRWSWVKDHDHPSSFILHPSQRGALMSDNFPQMTLEAIRSVPLFASLDDEAAARLRGLLQVHEVSAGKHLFSTGDKGDAMYLIERGRVRISVRDEDKQDITLAELARGDFFGEMSIIDGKRRSADASVIDDARFAILSRANFMAFIQSNPMVTLEMLSAV